jgi:hypothetical protein
MASTSHDSDNDSEDFCERLHTNVDFRNSVPRSRFSVQYLKKYESLYSNDSYESCDSLKSESADLISDHLNSPADSNEYTSSASSSQHFRLLNEREQELIRLALDSPCVLAAINTASWCINLNILAKNIDYNRIANNHKRDSYDSGHLNVLEESYLLMLGELLDCGYNPNEESGTIYRIDSGAMILFGKKSSGVAHVLLKKGHRVKKIVKKPVCPCERHDRRILCGLIELENIVESTHIQNKHDKQYRACLSDTADCIHFWDIVSSRVIVKDL